MHLHLQPYVEICMALLSDKGMYKSILHIFQHFSLMFHENLSLSVMLSFFPY